MSKKAKIKLSEVVKKKNKTNVSNKDANPLSSKSWRKYSKRGYERIILSYYLK